MSGKTRRLVTNELIEFEKQYVEVQYVMRITDHFRGICRIYLKQIKEIRKISTCKLDLESFVSQHNPQRFHG